MPNLAQLIQNATSGSYYSRTQGEVISSLNEAGFELFTAVLKESSGFFIKFDETSLTLSPSQVNQEYTLPSDLTQIVHLAERQVSTDNWQEITPANNLQNVLQSQLNDAGIWTPNFGPGSMFEYYGPFLDSSDTTVAAASQIQKIRISPITDVTRFVQIAYTAKWLPLTSAGSSLMLPDEGTYAMEKYAIAKLLKLNNDSMADTYLAEGARLEQRFLTWVRQRQIQQLPQAVAYLEDYY